MLLLVLLPVIAGFVLRAFAANRPRLLLAPGAAFLALNLLGFGAGYFVQRHVIHFASRDAVIAWNSYTEFLPNLSKVVQGYFKLTNALPAEGGVTVLSGLRASCFGIAFVAALAVPCRGPSLPVAHRSTAPAAACRAPADARGLLFACLLGIVGVDTLILTGASLAYGEQVYESRYLIFLSDGGGPAAGALPALAPAGRRPVCARRGGAAGRRSAAANAFLCDAGYVASPSYDFSYSPGRDRRAGRSLPRRPGGLHGVPTTTTARCCALADQTKVYRIVTSSYNPGDYTYYQDGAGLENGSLLLATDKPSTPPWTRNWPPGLKRPTCPSSGCTWTPPATAPTTRSPTTSITAPTAAST